MKKLISYLNESLGKPELLDYIKTNIDDTNLIKLRQIYNIIADNPKFPEFEKKLEQLGLGAITDNIFNYFNSCGQGERLIDYITQPEDRKISIEELLANSNGNIINIISKRAHFTPKPIVRLSRETTTGGVKVGEYEYVLRMFLQNVDIRDKRGDLVSGGIPIELKCGSARISGAGTDHAHKIRETVNTILNGLGYQEVTASEFNGKGGKKVAPNFFNKIYDNLLKDNNRNAKEILSHMIIDAYTSQYETVRDNNGIRNILYQIADDVLFSGNKLNTETILPLIATTTLTTYHLIEGFEYIVVINKETSDFISICFDDLSKQYIQNVIYNMFATNKIKIKSIQNENDKVYGKGIQIEYGK